MIIEGERSDKMFGHHSEKRELGVMEKLRN